MSRATNFVAPDLAKKTKGAYNELYAEHPALVTFANGDIGVVTGVCGSPKAKGGLQLEVAPRNDVTSSPIKKLNVSELEGNVSRGVRLEPRGLASSPCTAEHPAHAWVPPPSMHARKHTWAPAQG